MKIFIWSNSIWQNLTFLKGWRKTNIKVHVNTVWLWLLCRGNDTNTLQIVWLLEENIYFKSADEARFFPWGKHSFDEDISKHWRPARIMFMHVRELDTCHISNWWKCMHIKKWLSLRLIIVSNLFVKTLNWERKLYRKNALFVFSTHS